MLQIDGAMYAALLLLTSLPPVAPSGSATLERRLRVSRSPSPSRPARVCHHIQSNKTARDRDAHRNNGPERTLRGPSGRRCHARQRAMTHDLHPESAFRVCRNYHCRGRCGGALARLEARTVACRGVRSRQTGAGLLARSTHGYGSIEHAVWRLLNGSTLACGGALRSAPSCRVQT